MKAKNLRILTAVGLLAVVTVGFATNFGIGTVSAFGLGDLAVLCPLGALGTMLASKMLVPRAVISLIFAVLFIVVLGRAFCAWLCPVPLTQKVRGLFTKKPKKEGDGAVSDKSPDMASLSSTTDGDTKDAEGMASLDEALNKQASISAPLSKTEAAALKGCGTAGGCSSCAEKRSKIDARHFVLGGSLLSAAVFGFPVFCLVCPVGLSFATILLFIRLFSGGDVTWSLIVVPFILIAEVVLFRKWCSKLCPLSAFMSLVGKANRTFKPAIDANTCIETTRGRECGLCAKACPEGIDPRRPERGAAWSECTKCRACVEACPTKALTMPFLPKRKPAPAKQPVAQPAPDAVGSMPAMQPDLDALDPASPSVIRLDMDVPATRAAADQDAPEPVLIEN